MRTQLAGAWRRNISDERGVALLSSMIVLVVVASITVGATQLNLHATDSSASDRKRVLAIGAAEAGIDLALSNLQGISLPCSLQGSLGTAPTTAAYTATIAYYASYPATGSPLTCVNGSGPSAVPAAALVTSVGTASAAATGARKMETLVRLNPVAGAALNQAIFSNSALTVNNSTTLNGNVGNDADVYTNGNFTCNNNQTYRGSVVTQGSFTANNSCHIYVDVYAKNTYTANNSVIVDHDVKSALGNITMNNASKVGHDAIAHGTNTGGTVVNNRVSNAQVPNPPVYTFPTVNFNAAAWLAAGYTRQINEGSNCTQLATDIASMSTATQPTVIQTTCALTWNNSNVITLNQSLAIFSTGGFTANNNWTVQSSNSTIRKFMMIVPSSAATMPCASPGITLNNNTTFAATINDFLYTPCTITINNHDSGHGQIYGGSVTINNNFNSTFVPILVPGAVVSGGSASGYTVDLIYKREIV